MPSYYFIPVVPNVRTTFSLGNLIFMGEVRFQVCTKSILWNCLPYFGKIMFWTYNKSNKHKVEKAKQLLNLKIAMVGILFIWNVTKTQNKSYRLKIINTKLKKKKVI